MQEKTLDWLMSGAPSAPAGPEPVGLTAPPLSRAEFLERSERVSPTPRAEDAEVPEPAAMPEDEGIWFCAVCPEANVTRSDQDRCCLSCGVDLVSLGVLRALLSEVGLAIVTEAEAKVLDDIAASVKYWTEEPYARTFPPAPEVLRDIEKKLARRAQQKGKPHA